MELRVAIVITTTVRRNFQHAFECKAPFCWPCGDRIQMMQSYS